MKEQRRPPDADRIAEFNQKRWNSPLIVDAIANALQTVDMPPAMDAFFMHILWQLRGDRFTTRMDRMYERVRREANEDLLAEVRLGRVSLRQANEILKERKRNRRSTSDPSDPGVMNTRR